MRATEQRSGARPLPDEAPPEDERTPQPEREEPRLRDPGLRDLSFRDWRAIFVRAFKGFLDHNGTMLASALAYSTFFAIPSVLLVTVGVFTLVVGPDTISSLMAHFSHVMPAAATSLLGQSLHRLDAHPSTGIAMTAVGFVLALWSTTGAMTAYMTAVNLAYERKDGRKFVMKRFIAVQMVAVIGFAFVLVAVLLIFGPVLEQLVASHAGPLSGAVGWIWWIAQWPILLTGLLAAFATLLYLGPDVDAPALALPLARLAVRDRRLARRFGRLRVLHLGVCLVQQDLGVAGGGDHHAHLAVARRDRAAARRRDQCRDRAEPGAARRPAGRARAAGLVPLGLTWPLACSSARKRSR